MSIWRLRSEFFLLLILFIRRKLFEENFKVAKRCEKSFKKFLKVFPVKHEKMLRVSIKAEFSLIYFLKNMWRVSFSVKQMSKVCWQCIEYETKFNKNYFSCSFQSRSSQDCFSLLFSFSQIFILNIIVSGNKKCKKYDRSFGSLNFKKNFLSLKNFFNSLVFVFQIFLKRSFNRFY